MVHPHQNFIKFTKIFHCHCVLVVTCSGGIMQRRLHITKFYNMLQTSIFFILTLKCGTKSKEILLTVSKLTDLGT